MRFSRILPLAALVFAGACAEEAGVTETVRPPLAYIRYVQAVPDVGPIDFKFVDAIEYSPSYPASTFRTVGIYQGARAGTRRIKVFFNSSNINVTQIALVDTTLTLNPNQYYTILHTGYYRSASGTPAQRLVVIEDSRPTVTTGIHLSAVNAMIGTGITAQDLFIGTPAGAPAIANLTAGARSTYLARATGAFTLHTANAGGLVSLANAAATAGSAGTAAVDPVGGHSQAGTIMTAFLFPRSTACPVALVAGACVPLGNPQASAFLVPAIAFAVDRQPVRTVPE